MAHIGADKGYNGQAPSHAATKAGIELEVVSDPKPVSSSVARPRRWVVERSDGRINPYRPLVRSTKPPLTAHEAFVVISQIRLLLRRLDRRPLFDRF